MSSDDHAALPGTLCRLLLISFLLLCPIRATTAPGGPPHDRANRSHAVLFNVLCATCHEGECSGRLSFSSGPQAAENHIRRYAGEVDATGVAALFDLLNHMKTHCGYHPALGSLDGDGPWDAADLSPFSVDAGRGYFVPLGITPPGEYLLHGLSGQTGPVRLEVISAHFDFIAEACLPAPDGRFQTTLSVPAREELFLRLRGAPGLLLRELTLEKTP